MTPAGGDAVTALASREERPLPSLSLPPLPVAVVTVLMLASTVVWRRGDIFSGGVDMVVIGKAVLSVLALGLAFVSATSRRTRRRRLGTGSLWFLAVLLAASVFGALTYGTLIPSGVVAVRVLIVALTVFLLLRAAPPQQVFAGLVWSSGAVVVIAAATAPSTALSGRLEGGLPPLNPNEMAMLASVVVLAVAWRIALGDTRWYLWACAAAYLGVIWLTGSRTAMLMLIAAVLVMILQMRRPSPALVVGTLCAAAGVVIVAASTNGFTSFLERDGAGTSTLQSRFIAWSATRSWAESVWQMLFGGGLSVKLIPVSGQWWDTQLLDSSWVSALVQGGAIGLLCVAAWVLWVLRGTWRVQRQYRILFSGLLVYLIGRSFLESGLFDATPPFILFMMVSLLSEGGSRGHDQSYRREPTAAATSGPAPVTARPGGTAVPA
jgi:hypothetical protein